MGTRVNEIKAVSDLPKNAAEINIDEIPRAKRYLYTVEYCFPMKYETVAAFIRKNEQANMHVQEFHEICIISRGEGFHAIENTVVNAKRGDVFIIPPGRRHAIIGGDGFDVHYMHISPAFLERYLPRLKELPSFFSLFEVEPMMRVTGSTYRHLYLEERVLKEIMAYIEYLSGKWQRDAASKIIYESHILVILTILCREYENLQTKIGKNASNDKLFMDSILQAFNNYCNKLTIEELAKAAGMSRTAYIQRFRELTGTTPRSYITARRIERAKELLKATDKSINKIAEETGFYDAAHFSKAFAAATGKSPKAFRED